MVQQPIKSEQIDTGTGPNQVVALDDTGALPAVDASNVTGVSVGKNVIINGNFNIWQRGTSFPAMATGEYMADRWFSGVFGAGTIDADQAGGGSPVTDVPNGQSLYSLKYEVDTADASIGATDFYLLQYRVEGMYMQPLGFGDADAKTVTVSFWVKSSVTGTYGLSFRSTTSLRSYVAEYVINSADTWEYKTITIPGDTGGTWVTTNAHAMSIDWTLAIGTDFHTPGSPGTGVWHNGNYLSTSNQVNWMATAGNTFHISQVQLEVGSSATDFEHVDPVTERAQCQRYFTIFPDNVGDGDASAGICNGVDHTSGYSIFTIPFPTPMRLEPSISFSTLVVDSGTGGPTAPSTVPAAFGGTTSITWRMNVAAFSGGDFVYLRRDNSTNGYIAFDAEL